MQIQFNLLSSKMKDKELFATIPKIRKKLKQSTNPEEQKQQASYKLAVNTNFGTTNAPFNTLYDPSKMYDTTITGQLIIAKMIEDLYLIGCKSKSTNTDGNTFKKDKENRYLEVKEKYKNIINIEETIIEKV
jgi:hypothetical protein